MTEAPKSPTPPGGIAPGTQNRGLGRLATAATVLCLAGGAAPPPAEAALPRVTAVALYGQREFDAVRVRAYRASRVTVCVSGRCRAAFRWNGPVWAVAGGRLPFDLRRGQRRRVLVFTANRSGGESWGPRVLTVR